MSTWFSNTPQPLPSKGFFIFNTVTQSWVCINGDYRFSSVAVARGHITRIVTNQTQVSKFYHHDRTRQNARDFYLPPEALKREAFTIHEATITYAWQPPTPGTSGAPADHLPRP